MNAAVIVAAGRGTRMGLGRNKVLAEVLGVPVIVHTVRAFRNFGGFDRITVVTGREDLDEMRRILDGAGFGSVVLTEGGADRQESVCRGLKTLPEDTECVAIHDGARPLVSDAVIRAAMESAAAYGSGVAAVPLKDTVKRVDDMGCAVETPDRSTLRAVQTPQCFRYAGIMAAHERYRTDAVRATDDASLMERIGDKVWLTPGDPENIKLTTPEDMLLAAEILRRRTGAGKKEGEAMHIRVGHGYDVHRLVEGRKLILCGVEVPHTVGLLGHSDADVALHALMDALLGAAALGDIGRHFPDTDPAYKGADSTKLLDHVVGLLEARGYSVENVDVTIIAQKPKLKDYIEQMRMCVASHLKVEPDQVNIKATTTEKLGFEGEQLGISSHAVALIRSDRS